MEAAETHATGGEVPFFGARKVARRLTVDLARANEALERLGGLSLFEIEERRRTLEAEIERERRQMDTERAAAVTALEDECAQTRTRLTAELAELTSEVKAARDELEAVKAEVVETRDTALLQEAGVYDYQHPLDSAAQYQVKLEGLKGEIKAMTRADGGAVRGSTSWTVNGSAAQGRKMVRDFSKLMLRAYNAEADNLVRTLKPYKLAAAVERLSKVATTIERLGSTMDITVSKEYQRLRVRELELTADYLAKVSEEREREREERERLREERKAQQEIERERARLEKERQHYANAIAAVEENGDVAAAERLRAQLADVERAIDDVDYRAANIRAGYVYVISNIGSFGEDVVKIGMTRRLDPADRIRELGDASVPFRYDVHALFFSDDAVGIESKLHERFADRRLNRVNPRREFFRATPDEVKVELQALTGELLEYSDAAEALEFRQSTNTTPVAPTAAS